MKLKKILALLMVGVFLTMQSLPVLAHNTTEDDTDEDVEQTQPYKALVTKNGVNEDLRQEAYNAYARKEAAEMDIDIDIVPLFQEWNQRQVLRTVNNIGTRLLIANDLEDFARFEVSRELVVNAYTNYQGTITVYKGIIEYVENEDELAYIIGHELGHITQDDIKKKMILMGSLMAATAAGTYATGAYSRKAGPTVAAGTGLALASTAGTLAFTRGQEARADRKAIDYMVKAGYNPLAAISMQNKIMNRRWDFGQTHPAGEKRMFMAYKYIEEKYPKYLPVGFNTYSYERGMVVVNKMVAAEKLKNEQKVNIAKEKELKKTKQQHQKTKKLNSKKQQKEFVSDEKLNKEEDI